MKKNLAEFIPLSEELLQANHTICFRARGHSMYPAIHDGDKVEITPYKANVDILRVGDIIFYRLQPDSCILHRIVSIKRCHGQPLYITKGDAEAFGSTAVRPQQILGCFSAVERKGRRYSSGSIYMRSLAFFAVRLSALLCFCRYFLSHLLEYVQSWRFYRNFIRKIVRSDIQYLNVAIDSFSRSLTAVMNNKIVAQARLYYFGHEEEQPCGWWLFDLLVKRRYRRLGIGKNLVELACSYIKKETKEKTISVFVFEDNTRAIKFYQSLGFSRQQGLSRQEPQDVSGRKKIAMTKSF